jgi:Sec-independent protein translocase protein TatA
MLNFINNISPTEILVVALILVMFFGTKFVTGLAKTSGATLKEAKKIKKNFIESLEDDDDKVNKPNREAAQ